MKDRSKTSGLIEDLRMANKSYNEISKILGISKATVSYHAKNLFLNEPVKGVTLSDDELIMLRDYYKNHTIIETAEQFGVCSSTVKKYVHKKRISYTDAEKKLKRYNSVKTWRQKMKERAVIYLGGKCIICGYDKCIWALEFHHRDPKCKDFGISEYSNLNWKKIEIELDKCDLLCSNCHKETHHRDVFPLPDKQ